MTRTNKRILTTFAIIIGVLVLIILIFDWNWLKGPIERKVSAETGRSFAINGDLDVKLSRYPLVSVQKIALGNAPWGSRDHMLTIEELSFRVDLLKLLRGQVILPEVHLRQPSLLLEQADDKKANWQFETRDPQKETGGAPPQINALDVRDGTLAFKSPALNTDVTVNFDSVENQQTGRSVIRLQGQGRYQGEEFTLKGETGGVLALRDQTKGFPLNLEARAGKVRAKVDGHIPIPLGISNIDLNLDLEGPDFAKLYPLVPVPLPESPPFRLRGHLTHAENTWYFRDFSGHVGDSDLSGDFQVTNAERTSFSANLMSNKLAFKDIAGFVHAKDKTSDAETTDEADKKDTPPGKVLSQRPYDLERLQAADADVRFKAKQIIATRLPFDDVEAHFKLQAGKLTIDPLNFGVAGGNILSKLTLDARANPMNAALDLRARRLKLNELVPGVEKQVGEGIISGRGDLRSTGNSVATLLGDADGEVAVIMSGGSFSRLLVKLSNIDLAKAIPLLLRGDEKTQIRCVVADFKAEDGVFKSQTLVMDTKDTKITGDGTINLKEEQLDITLSAHGKSVSPLALHGPIHIRGTFAKPDVAVDKPQVGARVGAAVALGTLLGPLAAFLPVIEWGMTEDANCGALLQSVNQTGGDTTKQ